MPDGECRTRVVAIVVPTLNQPTQPKTMPDVADVLAMAMLDAVKVEVPAEPRRHRKHGWCESAETSTSF